MYTTYPIPRPIQELGEYEKFVSPSKNCKHRFLLARQLCSGGTIQYRKQCSFCGLTSGGAIPYSRLLRIEKEHAVEYKPLFATEVDNEARRLWAIEHPVKPYHISETTWYKDYMKSEEWAEKSRLVIEREQGICQACGTEDATQAHHLNYDHVGNEPLYDLAAVCQLCHEKIHGRKF